MSNFFDIDSSSTVDNTCRLSGNIKIGKNCKIINSVLNNCVIFDNVTIIDSNLDGAEIKNNVTIGPYSRIRPNTILNENVSVGNFVEIKNAIIGARTKIPHLSYVGDAEVGEDVNIGCGVVFCNYDGKNKHFSYVGNRVFIGSNSNIISPVVIEDDSFIAAGTTVTDNVFSGDFCIGRTKNEIKHNMPNLYLQNFAEPLKYFGTDGIRGIYGEDLTDELCVKVGYSLTKLATKPKILIGRDTRQSGEIILNNLAKGITSGEGEVFDVGVISTAGVAYLTKLFGFDYGVVITASHNPSEYNGIKIFNKNGYKLNENQEILLEKHLILPKTIKNAEIKKVEKDSYIEQLKCVCNKNLNNIKIFLDCANGAVAGYASLIFKELGAAVTEVNINGEINKNASVLNQELFIENMQKSNCDIGFCFDGDADRVMCITKNGIVLDGDKILYLFAKYKKERYVVGTIMTNYAIEKHLKGIGTRLIRVDVGDRNIAKIMKSKKYKLGAEQSGHIILSDYSTTGDGLLTALVLTDIYCECPQVFNEVEQLNIYSTINLSVKTQNKAILKKSNVMQDIKTQESLLSGFGRVVVRPSGTEPKIRIMVECENYSLGEKVAQNIKNIIENALNNG